MNAQELKVRLISEGVSPEVFRLFPDETMRYRGLPAYEGIILQKQESDWMVSYCERGMLRKLESFANEESACDFMYAELKSERWASE